MIGYATLGTADMARAKTFYCGLFEEDGAKVQFDAGRIAFIGASMDQPMVAVCTPYDENDPQPGNGTMIAFPMPSKAAVDARYKKAIALGATDDGEPGQRIPDVFYGSYVRDPDGNKLCFFIFG